MDTRARLGWSRTALRLSTKAAFWPKRGGAQERGIVAGPFKVELLGRASLALNKEDSVLVWVRESKCSQAAKSDSVVSCLWQQAADWLESSSLAALCNISLTGTHAM